jgi:hypothetical protein
MCAEFLPGNAAAFSYDELKSVEGSRTLRGETSKPEKTAFAVWVFSTVYKV